MINFDTFQSVTFALATSFFAFVSIASIKWFVRKVIGK